MKTIKWLSLLILILSVTWAAQLNYQDLSIREWGGLSLIALSAATFLHCCYHEDET